MPADLQKARELFLHAVGKLSPEEWDGYVAENCGDNSDLRRQVGRLLKVHREAGSFLEVPAAAAEITWDFAPAPGEGTAAALSRERPGTVIGPYKLLQQIGEGGMGTVYMAEQNQPVQRKVALKVIKAGLDSAQVVARFEAERQALAMMNHVNIARVLDAGATESGRPYFVMELVHGVPITKYCDDLQLTPRERLELFVPVCQAIQHAHQKGVIHRDVKPSNVLVAFYDGKPVPKVIDFGVAKAIEQKLTERTLFTQYGAMVGTLEYMSPEQAEIGALGVDTRSDVFSLGVLLYELLTGSTPLTRRRINDAAYGEILRIIKEEEPPKPSTRLTDSGEALASISAQRKTEPAQLSKLMRGELDWIVMKTLEKDRNRRYETANGLAADLKRYLNDEAVSACPPSMRYRLWKFARRNKRALLTAALLGGTLITAVVLLSVSYLRLQVEQTRTAGEYARAEAETLVADQQRAEAEDRLKLVLEALDSVYVQEAEWQSALRLQAIDRRAPADAQREQAERQFLEKGLRFYEALSQRPGANPAARVEIGRALRHIGVIRRSLRQYKEFEHALREASHLFEQLAEQFPEVAEYALENADTDEWLYWPLSESGRDQEAEQVTREALALFQKLATAYPNEVKARIGLARCQGHLANMEAQTGRLADAARDCHLAEGFYRRLAIEFPRETEYRLSPAETHLALAHAYAKSGQQQEAAAAFRDSAALHETLIADAASTTRYGRPTSADDAAWYRHELGYCCVWRGDILRQLGQLPEADAVLSHGLEVHEKLVADFPAAAGYKSRLAWNQLKMGEMRKARGQRPAAEQVYRDAVALLENAKLNDWSLGGAYECLGELYKEDGRISEAVVVQRKAVAAWEKLAAETNERDHRFHLGVACDQLGWLLKQMNMAQDAEAAFRKSSALWEELARAQPDSLDYCWHVYTSCQARIDLLPPQERNAAAAQLAYKAEAAFREAVRLRPEYSDANRSLGIFLKNTGRPDEAVACYRQAIRINPKDTESSINLSNLLAEKAWGLVNCPDLKVRDPKRAVEASKEAVELAPQSAIAWQYLGWVHYRAGNWQASIKALEESCKLQKGGDCGQWFVLSLAYGKLANEKEVAEQERDWRQKEARRWYDQGVKQIDNGEGGDVREAIRSFGVEARELLDLKEKRK